MTRIMTDSILHEFLEKNKELTQQFIESRRSLSASDCYGAKVKLKQASHIVLRLFSGLLNASMTLPKIALRLAHIFLARYTIRLLALGWVTPIVFQIISSGLQPPKELGSLLSSKKFSLVMFPSSAFEPIVVNTLLAIRDTKALSLMLVDNWDNLSSKTVLWELPDYLATWGRQSSQHAIEIQGMESEKVFEIGTARFSNHLVARTTSTISKIGYDYVLFVGTFLEYDEYACLELLNNEIEANPQVYGSLRVIYRPHP
jgi:hypothetical protein